MQVGGGRPVKSLRRRAGGHLPPPIAARWRVPSPFGTGSTGVKSSSWRCGAGERSEGEARSSVHSRLTRRSGGGEVTGGRQFEFGGSSSGPGPEEDGPKWPGSSNL